MQNRHPVIFSMDQNNNGAATSKETAPSGKEEATTVGWALPESLRQAGQQLLEGSAEFAEKGRQFMSHHLLSLASGSGEPSPNSAVEVERPGTTNVFKPSVDVWFQKDSAELIFLVDLPGLQRDEMEVVMENRILTISGCRPDDVAPVDDKTQQDDKEILFNERKLGMFTRSFKLGPNVAQGQFNASMNKGVLQVRVQFHYPTTTTTNQ